MSEEIKDPKVQWKNRRRMAWVGLITMVGVVLILLTPFVTETRISSLQSVLGAFFFGMTSIVGAYMGFATWADRK